MWSGWLVYKESTHSDYCCGRWVFTVGVFRLIKHVWNEYPFLYLRLAPRSSAGVSAGALLTCMLAGKQGAARIVPYIDN
jgi:hypothetical protein